MLYVDIPTPEDINSLYLHSGDACVSVYLPTTPVTQEAQADRITLKNLTKAATQQLVAAGADGAQIASISERSCRRIADDRHRPDHEHLAQIAIASFGDAAELLLAPA